MPLNLRVVMYDDRGYNYDRNKEGVGQELAPSVKAAGILTAQQPAGHEARLPQPSLLFLSPRLSMSSRISSSWRTLSIW